jgi:UDP-N-acetylmuramoyl-L-alanyl-D-glutamate--2,6-diaminopimelate ligase
MMAAAQRLDPTPLLAELLVGLDIATGLPEVAVAGLQLDSRQLRSGEVFVALQGTRMHGITHLDQAVAAGAVAVLAEPAVYCDAAELRRRGEIHGIPVIPVPRLSHHLSAIAGRFYGEPARDLRIIGVTGTNGKSSVTHMLAEALPQPWCCGLLGTLGYGFPGRLQPGTHTTPDAIRLQAELRELRGQGASAVAMEVSSHALHQHRVAAVPVHTAVFTNLTRDHLDYHGDMHRYGEAKAALFRRRELQGAVLNLSDPFGRRLYLELRGRALQLTGYGWGELSDRPALWVSGTGFEPHANGFRLGVRSSGGTATLSSRLLGRFNAENLLATLAVLLSWDVPLAEAVERLAGVHPIEGRMQSHGGHGKPTVVVDYAHTPDALAQALRSLRPHCPGRLSAVFGCGGERDRGKRPLMGRVAEEHADLVALTDDNPRHEDGEQIVAEILAGMARPENVLVERDRSRAIRGAVAAASAGDLILVAGKGHETFQQVGDLRLPFSDAEQVNAALEAWR